MPPRRNHFGQKQRTAKDRRSALTQLLYGCTPERLQSFTAESLTASYGVPLKDCADLLASAKAGRGA